MGYISILDAQKVLSKSSLKSEYEEWLTTDEAAAYLRISVNALRICVHRGQVHGHKFGRRIRFKVGDLRELLSTKGA